MLHNSFSSFQPPVIHQHEEITSVPPAKSIMFLFCIFNGGRSFPAPLLKITDPSVTFLRSDRWEESLSNILI